MKPAALLGPDASLRLSRAELHSEAELFARHLLGSTAIVSTDVLERYAEGCAVLLGASHAPEDVAVVEFVRHHAWSLPFVDAAAAILCPQTLIRRKLLLLLAVLETTPANVASFSPAPRSRAGVVLQLVWWVARSAAQALVGLPVLWLARRI